MKLKKITVSRPDMLQQFKYFRLFKQNHMVSDNLIHTSPTGMFFQLLSPLRHVKFEERLCCAAGVWEGSRDRALQGTALPVPAWPALSKCRNAP